ncbi:helix-turn-helix transcriptional regulator [Bacillus gobiensis]|uniref:helix-turn-helix domain-containing protein n=1 Tax=Bacillus gobiensis TaxID=1441095 RepID=UPI003D1DAF6F
MNKYVLNFDGSIGEFIKLHRKARRINSIELSKSIGKSDAYISHIENGRNKKPDYATLFEIFKKIGIDEKKIEDYLEHFFIFSPEREAHDMEMAIARASEPPTDEEIAFWEEQERQFLLDEEAQYEKFQKKSNSNSQNGNYLVEDIIKEDIISINSVLDSITEHDLSNAFDLIKGISNSFDEMSTNITLYKFLIKFFSERLSSLDNEGMIKVLNVLYEELNRIDREKTAFGKPKQRKLIKQL